VAIGLAPLKALARQLHFFEADNATFVAFALAAVLGGCTAWAADVRTPGGDEPSYLLISTSLLKDGDLDLRNNYAQRDYASFIGGDLPPDFRQRGLHNEIYSIHAPGVSAIVAPMFQVFGYTGARVMIVLLTSIGAMLIWRLCWRATDSPEAAWFAWAAVVLTPTFAMQSFSVFPDGPALLAVAAGVLAIVQLARGSLPGLLPMTLTGIALATLPWLHTRFAVLAGGLGAVIALRLLFFSAPVRTRATRIAALLVVPVVSALLWFYSFKVMYGTIDPRAPYANEPQQLAWIIPAMVGLFFDCQFGIAAYAPAVAAAFAGFVMKPLTSSRRVLVEIGLIALVYLVAIASVYMWWAGVPATPALFLMPILPILAVPLAVLWTRARVVTRTLLSGLAGAGAIVTAGLLLLRRAEFMWEWRKEPTYWLEWLSPVANLSRVWPSFFWDLPASNDDPNRAFVFHALVVVLAAALLWALVYVMFRRREKPLELRFAATIWAIVAITVISPISWAVTGARPLDPAPAQLEVLRAAGNDRRVVSIDAGRASRLRSFSGRLTMVPQERGEKHQPAWWSWPNVPAGRYTLRVRSTSAFPIQLRLMIARSAPWREFNVPGAGEFTFPFLIPSSVDALWIDGEPRPGVRVELVAEATMKDPGIPIKSAVQYDAAGVLFLDDMVSAEPAGFWVRGESDAEFIVLPAVRSGSIGLVVHNGPVPNQVSVESGTFQRMLVMAPDQEQTLDIPAGAGDGTKIRIGSGSGFVPSDKNPENADHRSLGVWIQIR